MNSATIDQALETLEDILSQERALLLAGRARETTGFVGAKMSALEVVDAVAINPSAIRLDAGQLRRMEIIKRMASENAAHFSAVRNGVQSLIQRIGRNSDDAYVGAYGARGAQTPFTRASGGYLKKV